MSSTAERLDSLDDLLAGLRAAAEPSRLRLLAICAQGEWTVSEITHIMGQSQPRVSRHLKVLTDAGLLEKFREGSWVFYRRTRQGGAARLARTLGRLLPSDDPELIQDRRRLDGVRAKRKQDAAARYGSLAERWDELRALHVDHTQVERALVELIQPFKPAKLLDIGTGTGRVLQVLAPHIGQGLGIDASPGMLAVARSHLDRALARNVEVRQGDMYALSLEDAAVDAVVLHLVLHVADDPEAVLREAARVLRPGGLLIIVDFAPHTLEHLRDEQAHRRLGFADDDIADWLKGVALSPLEPIRLPGEPLTVVMWRGRRPGPRAVHLTPTHAARDGGQPASDVA